MQQKDAESVNTRLPNTAPKTKKKKNGWRNIARENSKMKSKNRIGRYNMHLKIGLAV